MDDLDQYSSDNFKVKKSKADLYDLDQYSADNFNVKKSKKKKPKGSSGEPKGFKGVGQDIMDTFKELPSSILEGANKFIFEELPAAGAQIVTDPKRAFKNIGAEIPELLQGVLNTPRNVADYAAKKGFISKEHAGWIPKSETNIRKDLFGIEGHEAGDEALRALGNPLNIIPELGAASHIARALKRAAGGSTTALLKNENPVAGGAGQAILGGATDYAPKLYRNLRDTAGVGIKNSILNKARKSEYEMTPEQAKEGIDLNYRTPEGEVLNGDFGTLVGNKFLASLYKVTSHIPGAKGYPQRRLFESQIKENEKNIAQLEHKKTHEGLTEEEAKQKEYLDSSQKHLQGASDMHHSELTPISQEIKKKESALASHQDEYGNAPDTIKNLRHPTIEHGEHFETESRKVIKANKEEAKKLYSDFNATQEEINLNDINKKPEESKFHAAYEKHAGEIDKIDSLFGDKSEAGSKLVKEVKKLHEFFGPKEAPPQGGIPQTEVITPKQINDHLRNIQNDAAYLTREGKNTEAAALWDLASSLKDDLHKMLEKGGHTKEAASLKAGNEFFMKNIVPWSKNKETRKIIRDKTYKPNVAVFAKAIHDPNLKAVYDSMPSTVKNAAAYEMLVRDAQKTGMEGHYLSSKDVISRYTKGLSKVAKESIAKNEPEIHSYLQKLPELSRAISDHEIQIKQLKKEEDSLKKRIENKVAHGEKLGFDANKALDAIKNKRNAADKALERHLKENFHGKSKVSTKITKFSNVRHIGYGGLAASGIGAMGKFLSGHGFGAGLAYTGIAKSAKEFNKMMTDPAMVKHFLEGTKFKKPEYAPKEPTYKGKLFKALSILGTKQPLDIDMTGGHR